MHLDTPPVATPTAASKANESIIQPGEIPLGSTDVHGEQNPLDHITLMMGDSDSDSDSDEVRQAKSSSSKPTSEQDSAENTDADMPLDSKSSLHGGKRERELDIRAGHWKYRGRVWKNLEDSIRIKIPLHWAALKRGEEGYVVETQGPTWRKIEREMVEKCRHVNEEIISFLFENDQDRERQKREKVDEQEGEQCEKECRGILECPKPVLFMDYEMWMRVTANKEDEEQKWKDKRTKRREGERLREYKEKIAQWCAEVE
jgi:hypothetical protein